MDNSPFAKLPAELTNSIAELALYHEEGIFINDKKFRHASALSQTCKQMRRDYTEVFFHLNSFSLRASYGSPIKKRICKFGNSIGTANFAAAGLTTVVLRRGASVTEPLDGFDFYLAELVWEISTGRRSRLIAGLVVQLLYKDGRCLSEFYISQKSPHKCLETARKSVNKAVCDDGFRIRGIRNPNWDRSDFAGYKRYVRTGIISAQKRLRVTRG